MPSKDKTAKAVRTLVECSPHRTTGGGFYKGLMDHHAEYESHIEELAIKTFVLCHDVRKISSQPITETYELDGRLHGYTPDFIVDAFVPQLRIEVKSLAHLAKGGSRSDKYLAIAAAYRQQHFPFSFLVDAQLEAQPRRENVELLWRYANSTVPTHVVEQATLALTRGPLAVPELLATTSLALVDVWTLVATKHLCFDWGTRLDRHTSVVSLPDQPFGGLRLEDVLSSTRYGGLLAEMAMGRRPTDRRLLADAATWRRHDCPLEPWSFVGGTALKTPLRSLEPTEQFPRDSQRRRDFAPGKRPFPARDAG
ncbi:hypothetical protein [Uliginosibacterium sediminicola]|uniref:TnsA endonuclease-like protein n=1 Tax=Uliginosibacterium sediminicola TaxID=2024550 RepID=A0ABU9YT78_9RHOO